VALDGGVAYPDIESALRFAIAERLFDRNLAVLPPTRIALVSSPIPGEALPFAPAPTPAV
jgi:hypothetical protein